MSRRLKGEAGVDVSARSNLPGGLVTFLFTDIEGSTRLAQMLGGAYRALLHEHRRVIRDAVRAEGGVELFTEGDALFVAFTRASAALRACETAQRALADHSWPSLAVIPRVRMGLHTGHAEPVGGEYASVEVHRAARVSTAAHGGQVLCSAATARLAETEWGLPEQIRLLDLGLHRLRGFEGRERLYQLVAPGLQRRFPRIRTDEVPSHNLPAPTGRFVGRDRERAELSELLGKQRLVTVTGPGGVGKTRLAVEVARELIGGFPDGAWVVDLSAAITTQACDAMASPVELAVAAVLGLRPEPGRALLATIADYVASRRLLLVLDTCDAASGDARRLVSGLLSASGSTTVLATSREPLGTAGEVVWRLSPLCVTFKPGRSPAAGC
jgi:class 3 adenylate cyclase